MKSTITKAVAIVALASTAFSCQKETAKTQSAPSAKISTTSTDTANSVRALKTFSSPCGVAQLPPPSSDAIIAQTGTILSVNSPNGTLVAGLPDRSVMSIGQSSNPRQAPADGIYYGPISPVTHHGPYHLVLQGDGNLVLYREDVSPRRSIWSTLSNTQGANTQITTYLVLQTDGNLVLKQIDKNGNLVEQWASHSLTCAANQIPIFVCQGDGNLVELYEAAHVGSNAYAFLGDSGTGGGGNTTGDNGKFR